jgi:hypothetical protein
MSQTNALQPRSCTSIQTSRDTAELNWRNLRTFGVCLYRRMIGMRVTQSLIFRRLLWRLVSYFHSSPSEPFTSAHHEVIHTIRIVHLDSLKRLFH